MTRTLIWSVVAALVVAALAWFAFPYLFEQRSQTVLIPPSKEALQNHYLAAQRLLVRMGGSAQRLQVPYEVFKSEKMNVLLIPAGRGSLSRGWVEQLRTWVRAGGHVVIESEYYSFSDALLDLWNVERRDVKDTSGKKMPKKNEAWVPASVPGRDDMYRLSLSPKVSVAAPQAQILSQDESGVHVLQLQDGAGKVTVMTGMKLWTNRSIGGYDHAEFLWSLVNAESPPQVTILDLQALSLTDWLLHYAWTVLLTLSILILCWLWSVLPRFGPMAPDPLTENRRLYEHLLASGRLLWNAGLMASLSAYAREAAWRLVRRQVPFFSDLPPKQQAELLQQRYGLTEAQTYYFLQAHTPKRHDEFIRWISLCRQIQQRGQLHPLTTTGHL